MNLAPLDSSRQAASFQIKIFEKFAKKLNFECSPHSSASVIATQQTEPYAGKQERATNYYEKKKVDISSTSFNKLINLCVNCNCVTFFIIIRVMLLFFSEVMSYFNFTTSVFQNKRFP
jgi:hypothetical protein